MEGIENKVSKCRCREFENTEARILELELEIGRRKSEYEALEVKFNELEAAKNAVEAQLKVFGTRRNALVKKGDGVLDLTTAEEEEDKVLQVMIENSVLECEKKKAENEAEVWKEKFKELESWFLQLDDSSVLKGGQQSRNHVVKVKDGAGIQINSQTRQKELDLVGYVPACCTPAKGIHGLHTEGGNKGSYLKSGRECGQQARKHLVFADEESPNKKISPSTPGVAKPACFSFINICDSDDEPDVNGIQISTTDDHGSMKLCISTDHVLEGTLNSKREQIVRNSFRRAVFDQSYADDMDACKDDILCISTPKRKRNVIVTSDTESDEDDDFPIRELKKMPIEESIRNQGSSYTALPMSDNVKSIATPARRRLVTLRQREEKVKIERSSSSKTNQAKYEREIPTTGDIEDGESEQLGSESEDASLSFIVSSSDVSEDADASSPSNSDSDENMDFDEILSRLQRSKGPKFKWEFEADMLASFGKHPELCMKAVCALYRQQTSEEKVSKETLFNNNRGFSKFDALRGSALAEFLTDGDPLGDLKKSVEELQDYDSKAVELSRTLAIRYSKQLFEIYKSGEDPLFRPC